MELISEDISTYIDVTMPESRAHVIKTALNFISRFNRQETEEQYRYIMYRTDLDPTSRDLVFEEQLHKDYEVIFNANKIKTSTVEEVPLQFKNLIADFLVKMNSLETYEEVMHICMGFNSNEEKIADLLVHFCNASLVECLTFIEEVSDDFVLGLNDMAVKYEFSRDVEVHDEEVETKGDRALIFLYSAFTQEAGSLTRQLYSQGYTEPMPIDDLLAILPFDVIDFLDKRNKSSGPSYVAMDVLGLLVMGIESQNDPMEYISNNTEKFFVDEEQSTLCVRLMTELNHAFVNFMNSYEQELQHEDNNQG